MVYTYAWILLSVWLVNFSSVYFFPKKWWSFGHFFFPASEALKIFWGPQKWPNFWILDLWVCLKKVGLGAGLYGKSVLYLRTMLNISSVVEFQRWWVLKSKLFVQESTCSKEILILTSLNHLWFLVDGVIKVDYLDFPWKKIEILCELDVGVIACNF